MPTLPTIRKVRFEVRVWEPDLASPGREPLPHVDGVSLVDLVGGFELAAGYDVPGRYAGIVLDRFDFGDLSSYLAGEPDPAYFARRGVIALLGCDCGEVGCWPLEARVVHDDDVVTWCGFSQPFRPAHDYSGFGPFVFQRTQHENALGDAVGAASADERR